MSMSHVDNMTINVWNDIAFDIAVDENGKLNQNLFDYTIEELKDEHTNKLKEENEKLRECVERIANKKWFGEVQDEARKTIKEIDKLDK